MCFQLNTDSSSSYRLAGRDSGEQRRIAVHSHTTSSRFFEKKKKNSWGECIWQGVKLESLLCFVIVSPCSVPLHLTQPWQPMMLWGCCTLLCMDIRDYQTRPEQTSVKVPSHVSPKGSGTVCQNIPCRRAHLICGSIFGPAALLPWPPPHPPKPPSSLISWVTYHVRSPICPIPPVLNLQSSLNTVDVSLCCLFI